MLFPPATKTWPLDRTVAVKLTRAVIIEPVAENVPVVGSYSSALAKANPAYPPVYPPANKTLPLGRSVATAPLSRPCGVVIETVALKVPVWALAVRGWSKSARENRKEKMRVNLLVIRTPVISRVPVDHRQRVLPSLLRLATACPLRPAGNAPAPTPRPDRDDRDLPVATTQIQVQWLVDP